MGEEKAWDTSGPGPATQSLHTYVGILFGPNCNSGRVVWVDENGEFLSTLRRTIRSPSQTLEPTHVSGGAGNTTFDGK
jgi:hypothetical protein